jgi:hypothetical protein
VPTSTSSTKRGASAVEEEELDEEPVADEEAESFTLFNKPMIIYKYMIPTSGVEKIIFMIAFPAGTWGHIFEDADDGMSMQIHSKWPVHMYENLEETLMNLAKEKHSSKETYARLTALSLALHDTRSNNEAVPIMTIDVRFPCEVIRDSRVTVGTSRHEDNSEILVLEYTVIPSAYSKKMTSSSFSFVDVPKKK